MLYHRFELAGCGLSAHGLFSFRPSVFAALLEDPRGTGRSFLISSAGETEYLAASSTRAERERFLDQWWHEEHARKRYRDNPCVFSIWYAAYEAACLVEDCLPAPKSVPGGLLLWRHRPAFSLCFEPSGTVHVAAVDSPTMAFVESELLSLDGSPVHEPELVRTTGWPREENGRNSYVEAVRRVRDYIAAGDVFQANIARYWSCPWTHRKGLPSLYARLRRSNPAPFSAWLHMPQAPFGGLTILSSSPERLFHIDAEGWVSTRPIAGTRKRGAGEHDEALRRELLLSEKERAEHIMLVDLERNDLGRVCEHGSVHVDECMSIECYATVQHIVSNVRGRLRKGCNLVDVFRAMFPGGTITGCPKVRCMEIIHELEPQGRGPYTGGIGYSSWDGRADMNILIRTFWHHHDRLCWAAGAGIVADSDPVHELRETEHKAAGLMRALLGHDKDSRA